MNYLLIVEVLTATLFVHSFFQQIFLNILLKVKNEQLYNALVLALRKRNSQMLTNNHFVPNKFYLTAEKLQPAYWIIASDVRFASLCLSMESKCSGFDSRNLLSFPRLGLLANNSPVNAVKVKEEDSPKRSF